MSIKSNVSSTARNEGRYKQKNLSLPWYSALMKRPSDRNKEEVNRAYLALKERTEFEKFHPFLLQQLCYFAHYSHLDENILVIRYGDYGMNWYAVLSGSLAVFSSETKRCKAFNSPLCVLGPGACFGEAILTTDPHHMSVVTISKVEMLHIEIKDFKHLWEKNKEMMERAITPLAHLLNLSDDMKRLLPGKDQVELESIPNAALPITLEPSDIMMHAAWVLRTVLLSRFPHMIRDRKYYLRTYRRCLVGSEMIDWILEQSPRVDCRDHAVGMCQALVEEGVLFHVCRQHPFEDRYLFYRFAVDDNNGGANFPCDIEIEKAEEDVLDILTMLSNASPDARMRMIFRKAPEDRGQDDLELVYDELLQLKPLSHLSTTVKRELASVMVFEAHTKAGTVLFNQGDEGQSWYIILRGSVNVVIFGKGVVCVLNEGEDFGKLALMNEAPRAATIILREDNCHFLRVDKNDFNRILRDVEANTVRLKEHGQDVLVLEKIPVAVDSYGSFQSNYKYSVMAGTPDKMLEYLLEAKVDHKTEQQTMDTFLDDFLLTHSIFFSDEDLCLAILSHYHSNSNQVSGQSDMEFLLNQKKGVVQFVLAWYNFHPNKFQSSLVVKQFLETLVKYVSQDSVNHPGLITDQEALHAIISTKKSGRSSKKKASFLSRKGSTRTCSSTEGDGERKERIKPLDEYIFKVFCADHTYTTIHLPVGSAVRDIIASAKDKLCLGLDPVLCEVKSNGERVVFNESDRCIIMSLSLNGHLFIAPREHLDALTPLPEQEGPTSGTLATLELISMKELAGEMTSYDWDLFLAFSEQELLYKVIKSPNFEDNIFANLDQFIYRFNQIQFWVVTEMVLVTNVGKRVHLLRKFIKLAHHCKELQNMHAFFAIVAGLSNIAVSRLSQTWEKLPGKAKKTFSEYESLIDPGRNHRAYRMAVSKMNSPIIPFMPLLLKDVTFTNEGNKTYYDSLVNFEKMHMIAQTLRTIRLCRKQPMEIETGEGGKSSADIKSYVRNFHVIDNQRILTNLSHKCEPRKT